MSAVRCMVLAFWLMCIAGCGYGSDQVDYEVKVTATDQVITVFGCPTCPEQVNPKGFLGWRETRTLPRGYSISVGGKQSQCPTLTPLPSSANHEGVGKSWSLTVSSSGECVLDASAYPSP